MSTQELEMCRIGGCLTRVIWAKTENGKWMPLNPNPVDPGTKNARVLIGNISHGQVSAVERIAEMYNCDSARAYELAMTEYPWHVTHIADHNRARKPRQHAMNVGKKN